MSHDDALIKKGMQYLWHPCSQMKDFTHSKPLLVKSASGSYIELTDGKKVIDAISSWWCKLLGHNHPQIKSRIIEQIDKFEHVILANTTNEQIIQLSEKLANLYPGANKVFYASDGSSAVEIALKMSLHSRKITGQNSRKKFLALQNGYHGETTGALSVSDIGIYKNPYQDMLFDVHMISHIPYVNSTNDPLWEDCSSYWKTIETELEQHKESATAIILEPIVQGAGGMKIYSKDFLKRLRIFTKANNIHLIADEIMTGIARTGEMLACNHAGIEPDFLCLSKGLTSGWLPLSAVVVSGDIYDLFYGDYDPEKSFLHSHTYCGNALAVSAALANLEIVCSEEIITQAKILGVRMLQHMQNIAKNTGRLTNVRGIGAIVAADLVMVENHDHGRRIGFEISQKAIKLGALLRPIGNTIYWLPPVNMDDATLEKLSQITQQAIS
jgi:adenosylmethionine-8-amino-7-oxononanoate aminotransferase